MTPRGVVFRRELRAIFSEKTILLAILMQVFVAGFSSFLVVGLAALVDPEAVPTNRATEVGLSMEGVDGEAFSRFAHYLVAQGISLKVYGTASEANSSFLAGETDAFVSLKPGPDPATDPYTVEVLLPDGDLRATFTLAQVKRALEAYERELREERAGRLQASPIYLDVKGSAGSYAFVYGLLVPLLVFLPVVLAGALTADAMTEEVERGTLPLLLSSPASPADVVEGKVLANALIAPLLALAWLLLLAVNGLAIPLDGALWIVVGTAGGALLLGFLAAAIALVTREAKKAHVAYAMTLFALAGASLLLPVSPVNAVARLAAGSPTSFAHALVAGTLLGALALFVAFRLILKRVGTGALLAPGR